MDYFILELNQNYTAPAIKNRVQKSGNQAIHNSNQQGMSKFSVFQVQSNMQTVFADVLLYPDFMVSEAAKDVITLYEPYLPFRNVLLIDQEKEMSYRYYLPVPEVIDCLAPKSQFNQDKSVVYYAELEQQMLKGRTLVQVGGLNCRCILIRSDLAESMLRRRLVGIGLRETVMAEIKSMEVK